MTYKKDPELGQKVRAYLIGQGLENPVRVLSEEQSKDEYKRFHISSRIDSVMGLLGLDTSNESLKGTPGRVAKMYVDEIFYGLDYNNFPKCLQTSKDRYDEMVCSKGIAVKSTCEHHLVPFIGTAAVAYIPKDKIIGLSKLNRIVDFFSRRPQVQERLTSQIHAAITFVLETDDVAVVLEAEHLCVKIRGAMDQHSDTVTSKMGGRFFTNPMLRSEFLHLSRTGK